jgi:hypothetical protein
MSKTKTEPKFETEPMLEKRSHILGDVRLYAPDAPIAQWNELPWRLTTASGWEGAASPGLVYDVHPDHRMHAWHHIALVESRHLWA